MEQSKNQYDVIVVGGGPSGMMAAGVAFRRGKSVLLVEKNDRLGLKLGITGKGRCNLTNHADIADFFDQIPRNPSFLYSALYTFSNSDLMHLLEELGVPLKVERGGRVFPVSDRAQDVVAAMRRYCDGAERCRGEVCQVLLREGAVCGVMLRDGRKFWSERVILATGGASYPKTGSDGSGIRMAAQLGHDTVPLSPSLVPLCSPDSWTRDLQGLTLKNVEVCLLENGKVMAKEFGELLFTHFGVSGPVVLTLSAHMSGGAHSLMIDLKPALSAEQLDQRLQRDFGKYINRNFENALVDLLPRAMIPVIVSLSGIPGEMKVNQVTREQRRALCDLLKALEVRISGKRPLEEAIVTSGGVCVKEIQPGTMESRRVPGLFFAGEMVDVDAYTGGYNLQIAFSTGYLAGMHV